MGRKTSKYEMMSSQVKIVYGSAANNPADKWQQSNPEACAL